MYACMYVCMYVRTYVCMYAMYVYDFFYVQRDTHTHIYVYIFFFSLYVQKPAAWLFVDDFLVKLCFH